MYAVTTFPLLNLTLAIFLSPELGFFGLVVPTFKHTPFNSGLPANCGDRSFRAFCAVRPFRSTWIRVHLCAREAGRGWKAGDLGRKLAIEGRRGCAGVKEVLKMTDGRTRRRRNWTGMAAAMLAMLFRLVAKFGEWTAWRCGLCGGGLSHFRFQPSAVGTSSG